VSISEEIDHALLQALVCREDRKRGEQTLEKRKEDDAVERLQELVRAQQTATMKPPA